MTKKKSNWNLYNFPDNINDVDDYIEKLTELVKTRPELKPELEAFNNHLSGYMKGTLDTLILLKSMQEEVIQGRDDPNGVMNSEHLNMSEEIFMSYVDELNAKGQIPSGHWEDNKWGTKSYIFDKKKK